MSKARKITREEAMRMAEELIGKPGRMLYPSKSMGKPTTMFNAVIFNANAKQIWAGDMEIAIDKEALLKLAEQAGTTIYVVREGDTFIKFTPDLKYVKSVAQVTIEKGTITYSKEFAERVEDQEREEKENTRRNPGGF
ncbi:MAG: hypothetical protein ABSA46_10960 [Thermodesulfovibrionales bacterium]|jgi:hypothetical protein